ncbi:amino acid ABC transporter substrate-binding protein [Nisaea acidiphila]|uniref:Amino acid ABC transporter substrate-binding protein n=1 Tax=Nisaea acidiphila TaxID=1862145 RepID=A0A9J7AQP3_9PROT|nr:amino acid ABC transporter substrate-binding protein [Nisaea acidiphila]UUX49923.1 amino acid ABC transporter substrate-binding protein [Nisaea acidiphila]
MYRRILACATAALALSFAVPGASNAQDPIKFGMVAHLSGPLAGGEAVTHLPNVQLWAEEVNAKGGLMVGGERRPIEVVQYDDKTNPAEHIKAVQRLATQDEVDFMIAPYGTGFNIAAAPIYAKHKYPMVAVTAITDEIHELTAKFPNMFFTLGSTTGFVEGATRTLEKLRSDGVIGNKVAMVNVADAFGIELADVAREKFASAGFEIVYDKSYPLGTPDLSPVVKGAKAAAPDAFVAWSYPPDTFALTEQAIIEDLDVKAFYTAVATAFPAYAGKFGGAIEGNLGAGGVNPETSAMKAYRKRHQDVTGKAPDFWASATYYSALQVLQQAIEGADTTDRAAVTEYIKNNAFDTVIGTIEFDAHNNSERYWSVGQWRNGKFVAVADTGMGDSVAPVAKKGWK